MVNSFAFMVKDTYLLKSCKTLHGCYCKERKILQFSTYETIKTTEQRILTCKDKFALIPEKIQI